MDSDEFKKDYYDLFYGDPKLLEIKRDRERRMKPKAADGRGGLSGFDESKVGKAPPIAMAADLASMTGRLSGYTQSQKPPPNTVLDKPSGTLRPTISTNEDGTLDLHVD